MTNATNSKVAVLALDWVLNAAAPSHGMLDIWIQYSGPMNDAVRRDEARKRRMRVYLGKLCQQGILERRERIVTTPAGPTGWGGFSPERKTDISTYHLTERGREMWSRGYRP